MRKLPGALVAEGIDYSAYRIHDRRGIMPRTPGFGLKLEGRGRGRGSHAGSLRWLHDAKAGTRACPI